MLYNNAIVSKFGPHKRTFSLIETPDLIYSFSEISISLQHGAEWGFGGQICLFHKQKTLLERTALYRVDIKVRDRN